MHGHCFKAGLLAATAIYAQPVMATAQIRTFDVPAQSARTGLPHFARQAGIQILISAKDAANIHINAVRGSYDVHEGLKKLIANTGLEIVRDDGRTMTLHRAASVGKTVAEPGRQQIAMNDAAPAPRVADVPREVEEPIQEIIVTGTNIKRLDRAALPVSVIDQSAMEARNASTPVGLLTSLPQVTGASLNESANGSFSARGDFAAINLRGVGSGNTLVLLNGRRLVPHAISSTDEGGLPHASVNVNQLPTHGIDHLELLRDGASSIYGSDAVAGVVNYIVDQKFTGTTMTARATANEYGDGKEYQGSIRTGFDFASGRGHMVTTVDYYHRDAIFLKDRPYTADGTFVQQAPAPWNTASTLIPLSANPFYRLQAAGAYPSYRVGSSSTTNFVVPQADGSLAISTTTPVRSATSPGYYFNNNAYQAIVPSSSRINIFNSARFDINSRLTAFTELSFYQAKSTLVRQPISYNGGSFADQKIIVPASSPFNPFGQPVTLLTRVFTDLPNERDEIKDTVYRILGGLRGTIGSSWNWETAAYYNVGKVTDIGHNAVRESLLNKAVQAGTFNPFGYTFKTVNGAVVVDQPYSNPQSAYASILDDFRRDGRTSLASVDFKMSGKVAEIWAGAISVAFGGEHRRETFSFSLPPYAGLNPAGSGLATDDNDFILFGPAANWSASRKVSSLYGEMVVPLVSPDNDVPLVRSLEFTGSARFEHYSDFGSVLKPKVGATWRPTSWLLFRGSYNEGFRAPNLPMLNGGERKSLSVFLDPLTNISGPRWTIFAGNANLKPEESTGRSLGFVLDIPFIPGLSFSADHWQIRQRNLITTVAVSDILLADAALLNPIIAAHPGVPFSQQSFGSGTSAYAGDPRVIRNADNSVYGVRTPPFNSAHSVISGVDLSLSYRTPQWSFGRFTLQADAANLRRYDLTPKAGALVDNKLGRDGAAKWRGNLSLSWENAGWSVSTSAYYVGSFQNSSITLPNSTPALLAQSEALYQSLGRPSYIAKVVNQGTTFYRYVIPATTTFNASIGYSFDKDSGGLAGLGIRLGVVNLTDRKPPVDGTPQGYTTAVYGNLLPGRTWTLDITKTF
ncbi:TonB-dependent receptor [Sphingobium sp.]|uniref:TonB-dependent receptor n=1 Tax=Sphingobium sp. TaxID=1912891 RepID=UPI0028BF2EB5|nr:TonB-dependent receptor [Sphingobium sp.]